MHTTLAHLSDLHLGSDFVLRSIWRRRKWWNTEDQALLKSLEKALRDVHPDYVLITGDIVNKCTLKNFNRAAATLRRLLTNAGIDIQNQVLIMPGNHDVKVLPTEDKYFGRVHDFLSFLQVFFDEKSMLTRKTKFVRLDVKRRMCFFCLDTTLKEEQPAAEGKVGNNQLDWLLAKYKTMLSTVPDFEKFVKIAALHHHPHPVQAGGQERFMQLLDHAEVINAFRQLGVNLVLHGHKHFPHQRQEFYATNHHYVVAGAGTTTCPFREEQGGEGNNFYIMNLDHSTNMLEIMLMKAGNDKEYRPHFNQPLRFPLFARSATGYKMAEFRYTMKVLDTEGTSLITGERVGLVVDGPDSELTRVRFGMGVPSFAEILAFDYDKENTKDIEYETKTSGTYRGYFVLRNSLKWGNDPIGLNWYTFKVKKAVCMQGKDYQTFYPGNTSLVEAAELVVVHPCDQLTVVVEYPPGYRVEPRIRIKDPNGVELDPARTRYSFKPDQLANRYSLVVFSPKLQHEYAILWTVP